MIQIHFLTSILPKQNYKWIKHNSKGAMSNANDSFQRAVIDGLLKNGVELQLLNVPNIGAFPFRFKKIVSPNFTIDEGEGIKGNNFGFTNVNLLKHKFIENSLEDHISKIANKVDHLLIYDLYLPFLKIAKFLKSTKPHVKIVIIIPDIYGFTGYSNNLLRKILTNNEEEEIYKNLKFIDGFVLLTDQMKDKLPSFIKQKQSIVLEGILNPDVLEIESDPICSKEKIVLYSGAIEERHGVLNLIKSFKLLRTQAQLHLYGDGSAKEKVLEAINGVNNIHFFGQRERITVLKKQKEATLLVNPRTSEGDFTQYSFPSKIIEYFASGVPTLMYKLDGIPDNYYNHCFVPIDESIEALALKLSEILNLDANILEKVGQDARNFILENKKSDSQAKKILKLFEVL